MKRIIRKNSARISLSFIFFVIGFVISALVLRWNILPDKFWDFSFSNLLNLLVTIIVALFVTHYISESVSDSSKKKEIVLGFLADFRSAIEKTLNSANDYTSNPSDQKAGRVDYDFNCAMHQLNDIKKFTEAKIIEDFCFDDNLENCFLKYKMAVTNDPFKNRRARYTELQIQQMVSTQHDLLRKIDSIRLKLYE
ncbi:MAG: hypothetical protein WCT32_01225 [Patescibacteria group bacterium]|jgi:hypothetical protein